MTVKTKLKGIFSERSEKNNLLLYTKEQLGDLTGSDNIGIRLSQLKDELGIIQHTGADGIRRWGRRSAVCIYE